MMPGVKHTRITYVKNDEELNKELKKYEIKLSEKQLEKLKDIHSEKGNSL